MGGHGKQSTSLSTYVPKRTAQRLDEIAAAIGVSRSILVRAIFVHFIEETSASLHDEVLALVRARAEGRSPQDPPGEGLSQAQVCAIIDANPEAYEKNPSWTGNEWVPVPKGKGRKRTRPPKLVLRALAHQRKHWGQRAITLLELQSVSPLLRGRLEIPEPERPMIDGTPRRRRRRKA